MGDAQHDGASPGFGRSFNFNAFFERGSIRRPSARFSARVMLHRDQLLHLKS